MAQLNGHEYVDLKLPSGVLWSKYDYGSNSETSAGGTYPWYSGTEKYNPDITNPNFDGRTVLELSDDIVNKNWGGNWCIPSKDDWQELINLCNWEYTNDGVKITYKDSQNCLYLPFTGNSIDSQIYNKHQAFYWSKDLNKKLSAEAFALFFNHDNKRLISTSRFSGLCIRPVIKIINDIPVNPNPPDEPVDPDEDTTIKVVTYNIRYWNGASDSGNTSFRAWPDRKAKVFEMIRKHDMDVCGLQEVTPQMQPDIDNTLTEYEYIGYGRDSGLQNSGWNTDEQTGLIYKKSKFNKLDQGKFFLTSTPDKVSKVSGSMLNRLATWVKLQDKETLKEFIFASTHFDHPTDSAVADSVREQQAQYAVSNILSIAGNLPIFFVGDFNSESNTSAYSVLTSTFNDSYNFLTEPEGGYVCNLDQINSGKCPGCSEIGNTYTGLYSSSDIDPKRIDYVFYLSDKSLISSYLADTDDLGLEKYPSDHLPVVVTFKF